MPKVSVIIPTYNRAGIVPKAIESVFSQIYRDYELIVVDDGSKDGTREVVDDIFSRHEGICRYVYQENGGEPAARNLGISIARGDYVAFLDSDDWWLPDHLTVCLEALEANASLGAVFTDHGITQDAETFVPTKANVGRQPDQLLRSLLVRELVLASDALMIRREVFSRVGNFNEDLQVGTDWEMWVRIASKYQVGYVPRLTVIVHQHAENTSAQPRKIETHARKSIEAIMKNATPEVLALRNKVVARLEVEMAYFYSLSGNRFSALKKLASALRSDPGLLSNGVLKATLARIALGRQGFERLRSAKQKRSRLRVQSAPSADI